MSSDEQTRAEVPGSGLDALRGEMEGALRRMQRVLMGCVTGFIIVALATVALLLSAGITVLRQTGQLAEEVKALSEVVAVTALHLGGFTNRLSEAERVQLSLASRIGALQNAQDQAVERLGADLRRQARWIESKEATDEREQRRLNERLLGLGEETAQASLGLEQVQRRLEAFVSIEGVVVVPGGTGDPAPTGKQAVPDTGGPDVFSAAEIDTMFESLLEDAAVPVHDKTQSTTISVVSYPNGDRYEGTFHNGLMQGWGIYVTRMGDRYEGMFENDLKHGRGTLQTASGERYTGTFVNGIRLGLGSLTRVDGTRYAGDFRNDMINGRGVMYYPDGNKYAGYFMNGRRHGHGVMRFFNGDVYEGEFRKDLRTGKGMYLFAAGGRYSGDFVDGVRHGNGHFYFADGAEYIGPFRNGNMHGEGVRIYPGGQRVKGLWHNGKHVRDLRE